VKYVIFKSKNPFKKFFLGRTTGRTGPKKEDMSSKKSTSGNPNFDTLKFSIKMMVEKS
jgi:hypothetical protein